MPPATDLLALEIDTCWTADGRGRLLATREPQPRPAPLFVAGVSHHGRHLAFRTDLPDALAARLRELADGSSPHLSPPSARPCWLDDAVALFAAQFGPVAVGSGPTYRVEQPLSAPTAAGIMRIGDPDLARLADHPAEGWLPGEWRVLLAGDLGPAAFALRDGRPASICHSARLTSRAAEAGAWTAPEHRGQGLAAATTVAWASLFAGSGHILFYSTAAENHSSRRVAARLGLREAGWLWQIHPEGAP